MFFHLVTACSCCCGLCVVPMEWGRWWPTGPGGARRRPNSGRPDRNPATGRPRSSLLTEGKSRNQHVARLTWMASPLHEPLGMAQLKLLPEDARPRERLHSLGPGALANHELVALLLGQGTRGLDALEVAQQVLVGAGDLAGLCGLEARELARHPGIGPCGGARIAAALELGRRALRASHGASPLVRSALDVYELMLPHVAGCLQETFWVLSLNARHRLIRVHRVAQGALASVVVHPREVFRPLVRHGAAAAILVHNHPSGDPEPSNDDLALTRRLMKVGEVTGIPVLDHLVVVPGSYLSLADQGLL